MTFVVVFLFQTVPVVIALAGANHLPLFLLLPR